MSETSPILGLPYIQAAQAQKHVTHNEAVRALDAVVQLMVLRDDLSTPPASADAGARYIVAAGTTGGASDDWSGQEGTIALREGNGWQFIAPLPGWRAWIEDAGTWTVYDGAQWIRPLTRLDAVEGFGLNATSSPGTPFVARTPQALWEGVPVADGGTGSVIQSLNRSETTSDAGFAFQTQYTTQGLLGFFGGSDLRLSVSTDGSSFTDALSVDPATGIARQPARPRFLATTNYDNYLAQGSWATVGINTVVSDPLGVFDGATNLFTAPVSGEYALGATALYKQHVSNDVRLFIQLVRNGTSVIPGASGSCSNWARSLFSSPNIHVLTHLEQGDTVAFEAFCDRNDCNLAADRTAFWGYLLP